MQDLDRVDPVNIGSAHDRRKPMPAPGSALGKLLDAPLRPGVVRWIGVRPARHAPMRAVATASLDPAQGLAADHYAGSGGGRQVSLVTVEGLAAIAAFLGRDRVRPELLRRNVVVAGINLLALKGRCFRLGGATLEYTGECHPCSRMEALLGPGGYNAVRGQGGIVARILVGGAVGVGDALDRLQSAPLLAIETA